MVLVGIDPDRNGAACTESKEFYFLETDDKKIQVKPLLDFLKKVKPDKAIVERPQSRTYGFRGVDTKWENYGRITGVLDILGIPYIEVSPSKWKKALKLSKDKEESINLALAKGFEVPKKTSRHKYRHHGLAEAFLLTVYYKNE